MDSPERTVSPPPRFTERGTPRFHEHCNESPPYEQIDHFKGHNITSPLGEEHGGELFHSASMKESVRTPTEIGSPLPESYNNTYEQEKEVYHSPVVPEPHNVPTTEYSPDRKRVCGISATWFWAILIVAIILGVALGVGLGIGLSRNEGHSSSLSQASVSSDYAIGGSIDPRYYSKEGAFNGSGIALASQSFTRQLQSGTQGSLVMYFQHWTGDIRWKQLSNAGEWLGGDASAVVAQDAKNNTPLSAVSYVLAESSTWHVFYIDQNNTIKQRSNSNTTNVWVDGPINKLNLATYDAETVGMQACWYGNEYGDSDYEHTPLPNETPAANRSHEVGMHLWYALSANTFQQLGWRDGDKSWEHQLTWEGKNGHAGVGCYSWGPGTVSYVALVNNENSVEFWWKDTNTNLTNTTTHPINIWTKTSVTIDMVHPSSSLGYTNYFYAQMADSLMLNGYNISWNAENTTIEGPPFSVEGEPGLPGTHFSVSALPNNSGGDDLVVFYQTNGSDISLYTRDLYAGAWAEVDIDISR